QRPTRTLPDYSSGVFIDGAGIVGTLLAGVGEGNDDCTGVPWSGLVELAPAGRMLDGAPPRSPSGAPGGVGLAKMGALFPRELGPPRVVPLAVIIPELVPPPGAGC